MPDLQAQSLRDELKAYEQFAFSKNFIGMAVALIFANTLQKFVASISNGLLMPLVNFFVNQAGSDWRTLSWTPIHGLKLEVGNVCGGLLEFFITTLVLYVLYYKIVRTFDPTASDPLAPPPPPVVKVEIDGQNRIVNEK